MYALLMAEKINKVIVVGITDSIFLQVFRVGSTGSQDQAFSFISCNLDVLGFVIGMMVLVGVVKESGFFEAAAIALVKKVKGNPRLLLIAFGYLGLIMTMFLSNIPRVLSLTPVLLVLIKELKLPYLSFLLPLLLCVNIGGINQPIQSDNIFRQKLLG